MNGFKQVLESASSLVDSFSANHTEAYCAAFSEDASFVFHNRENIIFRRTSHNSWVACHKQLSAMPTL